MTALAILGATGSIGRSTLKVVSRFPDLFQVKALTAGSNLDLLVEQIRTFQPEVAVVSDQKGAKELRRLLPSDCSIEILFGEAGYCQAAAWNGVDMVVGAIVGAAGLKPTLAAIDAGKDIALANKETLVMAGALVMKAVADRRVRLLPVDSEHSAIFQCLQGNRREDLDRIILTASGGPFRKLPVEAFAHVSPEQALKHPNWSMGAKITIDSATLMNKGLEVIEAHWLFDLPPDRIEVMVHPQSIVHSMVAYMDGSIIAQLGIPDMQGAIAYALSYPQRLALRQSLPDLVALQSLTFEAPDHERFPCLGLAYEACRVGGTLPSVLNAANETAVQGFLNGKLPFLKIHAMIERTMHKHDVRSPATLEEILEADAWAREETQRLIGKAA